MAKATLVFHWKIRLKYSCFSEQAGWFFPLEICNSRVAQGLLSPRSPEAVAVLVTTRSVRHIAVCHPGSLHWSSNTAPLDCPHAWQGLSLSPAPTGTALGSQELWKQP